MTDASDVQRVLPPEAFADSSGIGTPDDRDLELMRLKSRVARLEQVIVDIYREADGCDCEGNDACGCGDRIALLAHSFVPLRERSAP